MKSFLFTTHTLIPHSLLLNEAVLLITDKSFAYSLKNILLSGIH